MTAADVSDEYFLLGLTMVDALFTGDQKTFEETEKLFAPADLAAVFAHLSYTLALELGGLHAPEEPDIMVAARSALRALRFDYIEHMGSSAQEGEKE